MTRRVIPPRLVSAVVSRSKALAVVTHSGPASYAIPNRTDHATGTPASFVAVAYNQLTSLAPPAPEPPQSQVEDVLRSARIDGQPAFILPDQNEVEDQLRENEWVAAQEQVRLWMRYRNHGPPWD